MISPFEMSQIANLYSKPINADSGKVSKTISRYYRNRTDIEPVQYIIGGEQIDTCSANIKKFNIENIIESDTKISIYSKSILNKVGFNTDSHWNGEGVFVSTDSKGIPYYGTNDYFTAKNFHFCLYSESTEHMENDSTMPLREQLLSNREDLVKNVQSGSSSGATLFLKQEDTWKILIGIRSSDSTTSADMFSKIPCGGVEPQDLKHGFYHTAKREFTEELNISENTFDNHCEKNHPIAEWNLINGSLVTSYNCFIDESLDLNLNEEFGNYILLDVNNLEKILNVVNLENMSPQDVSHILYGLMRFDNKDALPNLEYDVKRTTN